MIDLYFRAEELRKLVDQAIHQVNYILTAVKCK